MMNQKGVSVLQAMITAAVVAIIALGAVQMSRSIGVTAVQSQTGTGARALRDGMLSLLRDDGAWIKTVNNNGAEMKCLDLTNQSHNNCTTPVALNTFTIYDNASVAKFAHGQRFKLSGAACATAPLGASDDCPFELSLQWQPQCETGGTCKRAQAQIQGAILFKPGASFTVAKFNPENYQFNFVRTTEGASNKAACDTLGGVYTAGGSPECAVCPNAGEFKIKNPSTGVMECKSMTNLCGAGNPVYVSDTPPGYRCTAAATVINVIDAANAIVSINGKNVKFTNQGGGALGATVKNPDNSLTFSVMINTVTPPTPRTATIFVTVSSDASSLIVTAAPGTVPFMCYSQVDPANMCSLNKALYISPATDPSDPTFTTAPGGGVSTVGQNWVNCKTEIHWDPQPGPTYLAGTTNDGCNACPAPYGNYRPSPAVGTPGGSGGFVYSPVGKRTRRDGSLCPN